MACCRWRGLSLTCCRWLLQPLGGPATTAQVHPYKLTHALMSEAQQGGCTLRHGKVEGVLIGEGTAAVQGGARHGMAGTAEPGPAHALSCGPHECRCTWMLECGGCSRNTLQRWQTLPVHLRYVAPPPLLLHGSISVHRPAIRMLLTCAARHCLCCCRRAGGWRGSASRCCGHRHGPLVGSGHCMAACASHHWPEVPQCGGQAAAACARGHAVHQLQGCTG